MKKNKTKNTHYFAGLMAFAVVLVTAIVITSFFNFDTVAEKEPEFEQKIENLMNSGGLNSALWSITVRDKNNKKVYEINSNKLMTPASNLKLVSSAAILNVLGPKYKYKTNIYGKGALKDGIWKGDIYVVGSGDPTISGTEYGGERFYVFRKLTEQLKEYGIEKIEGDLIFNDGLFDRQLIPKGWLWDDLSYYYAVPLSALSFNNNCVDLEVRAKGPVGSRPSISWFPFDTDYVSFVNEQLITNKSFGFDESYQRELGSNTYVLRSNLPRGFVEGESLSVNDPTEFFADTFKKYIESQNILVSGNWLTDHNLKSFNEKYTLLASHKSKPVSELLKRVNKKSDNFYTEQLFKTASAKRYQAQGSTELGIAMVKDLFGKLNVDSDELHLMDGSGLSPNNLISTSQMTEMLIQMKNHKHFDAYEDSLSVAGIDGSLNGRFSRSIIKNKFKGKSGYIEGTRAISGYLTTSKGKKLAVSIITNHFIGKPYTVDRIHKGILETIYRKF
ncbi:MAG: D-alanyl-D-alanine carboxypeptidase/D-alanyl-D-alanine-endopeptidase [Candidatus Caenarcaniphilales bacterium]|nr:D-alanyl-D-alanine carboxypeptidase/D-alanyl-D-alanine-endopeptidase [Candidatus Caenarcaniphilales bacterium]